MARQIVLLLLVVFAVVGLAFAETQPTASAPAPNNDDIGNTDGGSSGDDVVEAPVGGPVSADVFPPSGADAPGPSASGAAAALKAYGVAGTLVAGVFAGFFSFY